MEVKLMSEHHQISRQLDLIQSKRRMNTLLSFLPDEILKTIESKNDETVSFTGVVLLIDIHQLTEIDKQFTQERIFEACATKNNYLSAIIETVHFYEGDILDFTPHHILGIWKSLLDIRLNSLLDDVILCAMNIKKIVDNLSSDMKLSFEAKQIISCGNISLKIIGDKVSKSWVVEAGVIRDCQIAIATCNSKYVLLTINAWGHLYENRYDVQYTANGLIQVVKRIFQSKEKAQESKYRSDTEKILYLCSEHLKFRTVLNEEMEIPSIKHNVHINNLLKVITPRKTMKLMMNRLFPKDIELFIVKHVTDKVKENQPLEYLTEIREAIVQTIYITPMYCDEENWFELISEIYCTIRNVAFKKYGCIISKQTTRNKTIIFIVVFGLHRNFEVNYCQQAVLSSQELIQELKLLKDLRHVNIKISNQLVHSAVLGHPLRRNYFVVGDEIEEEPQSINKIFCDKNVYENSKLPSDRFTLQNRQHSDGEMIFEYTGSPEQFHSQKDTITVIGRNDKLKYIESMIFNSERVDNFNAVVVKGLSKSGKSTILRKIMSKCEDKDLPLAYVNLCGGKSKPYFCVSAIYRQLYDFHASKSNNVINDSNARELWNFADTLQMKNSFSTEDIRQSIKIFENFFEMCKKGKGFSVIIIDDIQFIDLKSLQLLEDVLKLNVLRIVSAGQFEEDKLEILWKFSVSGQFKILHLKPLGERYIPELICHFLNVQGVMKRIVELIQKVCDGRPGWIETCLLELLDKGDLQIRCLHYNEHRMQNIIFPDKSLVNLHNNGYVRIALMGNAHKRDLNYITPNAITLNFFQSFPPYQQIIIKAASVIGDIFTRSSLVVILELHNNSVFTYAIKCLFDEEIFECGSKYFINNAKVITNDLSCVCYMKREEQALCQSFPKYAFCKILHFRNRILRKIAYELLSANQRKDLHSKITELLELENALCPQCSQHRSSSIIKIKKYKDMIVLLEANKSELAPRIDIKEIKTIIKRGITDSHVEKNNEIETVRPAKISIERFWNSTTCFCLEILTRIYSDLVHHSQRADHLAKQIFFMYQYGSILILIGELEDAIILLKEASQLCIFSDLEKHKISYEFSKFIFSRIVTSIAEAYYYLDNYKAAKNYILLCFRQQDIPIISMEYKFCFKLLRRNEKSVLDDYSSKGIGCEEYIGQTLAILMRILAAENQWKLALSVAERTIAVLKRGNTNISLLCDVYNSALDICNIHGDSHTCEQLEKCVASILMQLYSITNPIEFFAMAKLMNTLFVIKAKTDNITNAIRIGYRLYHLNYGLHAELFQMETVPILADLLISVKRIEDAAYAVGVTRKMMKNTVFSGESLYFVFCCDLLLDTSFYLEKIEVIERFAEKMYLESDNSIKNCTAQKYLVLCLITYFSRLCNWNKVEKWKCYSEIPNIFKNDFNRVKFKLRYLELKLLQLARNVSTSKVVAELDFRDIKKLVKESLVLSRNWNFFLPKCYFYIGYYYKLKRKSKYVKFLKLGLKEAELNGNLCIKCWTILNKNYWNIGHDNFLISDFSFVLWKKAREYTSEQWTQIMFPLPVP